MANQDSGYSSKFKAKVAQEALDRNKKNLEPLSDKYNVPVSVILTWAVQLERNDATVFATAEESSDVNTTKESTAVDVEIDDEEVSQGITKGVMRNNLDYKKLTFWSVLGVIFVVIFVQLLVEMYQLTSQANQERVSAQSEYYEVAEQNRKDRERLSSFGVVNIEEGIYRIPIDSVINDMAVDGE